MEASMEIDRGVKPLPKKKATWTDVPDFTLQLPSLENKMKDHFRTRGRNPLTPDLVAAVAVPGYFFTMTATWYLGMFVVMPLLCKDSEEFDLFLQRCLMVFVYLEMMANWLCIRYVNSSYFAYLKTRWKKKDMGGSASNSFTGNFRNGGPSSMVNFSDFRVMGDHESEVSLTSAENGECRNKLNGLGGSTDSLRKEHEEDFEEESSSYRYPWKPVFRPSGQTTYPYWSWAPCYVCEVMRPPRCHHCPVCQTCVLKRDHHCYFTGNCVGWRNQRHFVVFSFWAVFGCLYATYNSWLYFMSELWPLMEWYDLLAPVSLVRWLLGYVPGFVCLYVLVQTLLIYFILLSTGFLTEHLKLIWKGKTAFEIDNLKKTIEIKDTRKLGRKFRSVMGKYWLFSLLFPLHWVFEAEEDPEHWPSVKVYRH